MWRRLFMLSMAVLAFALPLVAQDEADWEILFYDQSQISILTADGISGHLDLPVEAQNIQKFNGLGPMQLSSDYRWFAFVSGEGGGDGVVPHVSIKVADLSAGTCCAVIDGPENMQADVVTIGPFSPDGTQFVANFARIYSPGDSDSVLAIIDVSTMSITQQLDMMAAFGNVGAFLVDWTVDGITLFPTCLACGGPIEGYYSRWNPVTGEIAQQVEYVNFLGAGLSSTGEYLVPRRDESRPVSNDDGMIPPANVLVYLPDGDPEQGTIVYFDPANLNLAHPSWVIDGEAYLLHNWNDPAATLVFRDGAERVVELPADLHFIAGTPDGWLMQRYESVLYQFRFVDGEVVTSEAAAHSGEVRILDAPLLGSSDLGPVTPIIK